MAHGAPLRFRSLGATLGMYRRGDRRLSQLPEGPLYAYALLFDPGPTELAKPFEAVGPLSCFYLRSSILYPRFSLPALSVLITSS